MSLGGNIKQNQPALIVNNYNTNTNQNMNSIDLNTVFEFAEKKIQDMESLSSEDTQIALEKLNELKDISNSKESRKNCWSKIGPIFKWLADKSVELAIAFMPIISQVLNKM